MRVISLSLYAASSFCVVVQYSVRVFGGVSLSPKDHQNIQNKTNVNVMYCIITMLFDYLMNGRQVA